MNTERSQEEFRYKGYGGCDSHCLIDIHRYRSNVVVVCSESPDNEGTSVTNMAEHIATHVCRHYGIDIEKLVWIEHYPEREGIRRKETWDICWFTIAEAPIIGYWDEPKGNKVFIRPKWFHLPVETKDQFISGDFSGLHDKRWMPTPHQMNGSIEGMWSK